MQLFVLDVEALGEAVAMPAVEGTIEDHAWSPDGARILVLAAGLHADSAGADGSGALESEKDLPDWTPKVDSWEDPLVWRRLWVVDVGTGEVRRLSREGLNVWEADWCGDGAVVAVASEDPGESSWYVAPLVLIDAASRATTGSSRRARSSSGSRRARTTVGTSPRSRPRAATASSSPAGRDRRGRRDAPRRRDRGRGRHVAGVARERSARVHGAPPRRRRLRRHRPRSRANGPRRGPRTRASGRGRPTRAVSGADGFAFVRQGFDRPLEVAVVEGGSIGRSRRSGTRGTTTRGAWSGGTERVTWTAPDGLEIDGYLLAPPGEGPHPLILWVHGGPVWSYQQAFPRPSFAWLVSRGYAVLLPNPRGSTGRGRAFLEAVIGDMGGADAGDDLAGVDAMVERGVADPERIGVTGGSYGGFMSCWLPVAGPAVQGVGRDLAGHRLLQPALEQQHRRVGLVVPRRSPGEDLEQYRERSPVFLADRVTTPTLLTAGTEDRCTPPGQAIEFYRALRERGVPAEVAIYPGEGHGVRKFPAYLDLVARITAWFERFMPARS